MNATFLLVNKIKMMMLFNVVHRKVHKNMTKKGLLPVVVLRSKSSFRFPFMPFYCFMSQMSLWIMSQVMSQISISLHNMRFISHARRTLSEARDEGRRKINKCFIFSSPSPALRAKCRVGLAWLIKRLSCRLDPAEVFFVARFPSLRRFRYKQSYRESILFRQG